MAFGHPDLWRFGGDTFGPWCAKNSDGSSLGVRVFQIKYRVDQQPIGEAMTNFGRNSD